MVIHKFNIRYLVVTILPILLGLLFMHSSLNLELARAQSPETTPKLAVVGTDPEHSGSTIFMMDTDGENIVALTNDDFDNYSPVWSPDGTKLAFVTVDSFNLEDTRPSLAIIQMGTTLERTVIYHPTEQADNNTIVKLAWSPDSTMLVFFSQGVIHLVSADGSQNQIVTVADAEITSQNVFALGWTKDSKQLLIEYVPADHIVALQVNLDGSDPQEIPVQKNSVPIGENFSPDGNYAYNPSNPLSIFNYKDLINQPIDSVQAEEKFCAGCMVTRQHTDCHYWSHRFWIGAVYR
ncbi:MAG: hypothetical protein R3E39_27990 [Anaerolineae bacterium]